MRYFTSDTHFGDDRLNLYSRDLVFKNSEDFTNAFIKNWNDLVTKNDTVIHLGDVAFSEEALKTMDKLNGIKILIKGNYDSKNGTAKFDISDEILLKYFDKVYGEAFINIGGEKIYLNHYPTNCKADYFNITGHIHGTWKVQRNMLNVGCDAWNFRPISEETVKFQINGIRNHYDENVFAGELECNLKHKNGK